MTSAYRRFVVPGLSTLVMLLVLIGLGMWQVQRLNWKSGVLARISAAESAPAVPLTQDPTDYAKVSATGRFRYDLAAEFGAEVRDTRTGPTAGSHHIVPLETTASTILVDRGWVPEKRTAALAEPTGEVTVTGYIRPGEKSQWFSASDDVAARRFYTLDPKVIAAALGIANPAPFVIVALGSTEAETYPVPAQHLPRPPNNHLSYAITWYGLAIALTIIFGIWVRKALRS